MLFFFLMQMLQVWKKASAPQEEELKAGIYQTQIMGNRVEEIMLGVNLSRKSDVLNLLNSKQELGVDPFCLGYGHAESEARKQLDLTKLHLCFRVYIPKDRSEISQTLAPVYSKIIHHNVNKAELNIIDISDAKSSFSGGEKKILVIDN